MQRDALKSRWQVLAHVVGVVIGWILFGWGWVIVADELNNYHSLLWLIGATLVASPLVTAYWVFHTLAIFKAKGERSGTTTSVIHYEKDWNGTPVLADWGILQQARITVVEPSEGSKRYRPVNIAPSRSDRQDTPEALQV